MEARASADARAFVVPQPSFLGVIGVPRTSAPYIGVSMLTLLVGWEPALVLRDVRGLGTEDGVELTVRAARAVVADALGRSSGAAPDA